MSTKNAPDTFGSSARMAFSLVASAAGSKTVLAREAIDDTPLGLPVSM